MDVSLVTSLYRAASFLAAFSTHITRVIPVVQAAGITIELIIVANDATDEERAIIDQLPATLGTAVVRPVYVPRETLYASWNRGIEAAQGQAISFWNVDDVRTPEGIIACWHAIQGGCELVYPGWVVAQDHRWLGLFDVPHRYTHTPQPYDRDAFYQRLEIGPFFMFAPSLYQSAGAFDPRFRIAGDFEWSLRAIEQTKPCGVDVIGGTFYRHGENLSSRAAVTLEYNISLLLNNTSDKLVPAPPHEMRELWSQWADDVAISDDNATYLWGDGAAARWDAYQQQQAQKQRSFQRNDLLRMVPRLLIDRLGLRPLLYRLGVVKSPHRRT